MVQRLTDDLIKGAIFAAGDIKMAAYSATPSNWLPCDGAAVSRTTYADLFSAIGTTWGAGDGSTTFNVPNLAGRAPIGVGQGDTAEGGTTGTDRALAATGGAETHTLTTAELAQHLHAVQTRADLTTGGAATAWDADSAAGAEDTANAGSGDAHNNMPPFAVVNFFIYAGTD